MTIWPEFFEMRTANYTQIRSRRCGSRPSRGTAAYEAALQSWRWHHDDSRRGSAVGVEAGASPGERR